MIIGIDIDDTISDTYEVMFNYAQEYTINILKKEPIIPKMDNCDSHSYIKFLYNWNNEEENNFFKLYFKKIIKNVKPKTLCIKYLRKLKEEGHKIVLITARWQSPEYEWDVEQETKKWVENSNIPYDKLITNALNKAEIAKKENIEIFIDDSLENCQGVSGVGIKTYIMDTRVNGTLDEKDIERVYSWPHVYMKIKDL